jgi:hypothetical protein
MVQAAINNGEERCLVWQIYAARGMGSDASVAGNGCDTVTEGYQVPAGCECVYPQPPTGLQATVTSPSQVDLAWQSQASGGAVAYQVFRSDEGCWGTFAKVGETREPVTSLTDTVPGPGGYGYVVKSVGSMGSLCASESECYVAYMDCTPASPDVTPDSVKVYKAGAETRVAWLSSGTGNWNLHATGDRSALTKIYMNRAAFVAKVAVTEYVDSAAVNPGETRYIQVFGADDCTGASVP